MCKGLRQDRLSRMKQAATCKDPVAGESESGRHGYALALGTCRRHLGSIGSRPDRTQAPFIRS
jgi:hypothetical protein